MAASRTNPKVDTYLKQAPKWRDELTRLRTILLGCEVTEELKWGKPCYTVQGRNVAILIPFKESCALMFCQGALLKDPKRLLLKPGENTQAGRWLKFTSVGQIAGLEPTVKAYLEEAIAAEKAGLKVALKKNTTLTLPAELKQQLDGNPALRKAFAALTPGRQRAYALYFAGAKQTQTRAARVEKCAPRILAGQGLNDR